MTTGVCDDRPSWGVLSMLEAIRAAILGWLETCGQATSWFLRAVSPQVVVTVLTIAFLSTLTLLVYYRWLASPRRS